MTPGKAHAILSKSKLPKLVLAQIWKLSDIDEYVYHWCSLSESCLSHESNDDLSIITDIELRRWTNDFLTSLFSLC